MDLLTCYQTRARGQVHIPRASYPLVHPSLCFANAHRHVLIACTCTVSLSQCSNHITIFELLILSLSPNCDPICGRCRCGLLYFSVFYKRYTVTVDTLLQSQERVAGILTVWSCDHWQLSSVVTQSWTVFGWSQIVTPVTVCDPSHCFKYSMYWSDHLLRSRVRIVSG